MAATKLNQLEIAVTKDRRAQAEASLACEGMFLTAEEKAMFDRFEAEGLPHDECRRQLLAFIEAQQPATAPAAE